jgi:hypothetical protein
MTRRVDALCARASWPAVLALREDCRAALARGKQLWPIASYCEYRLALEAPAALAAQVLVPEAGRFALGPLTEVVAVHHTWAELEPHVGDGPVPALAAHERVVRGEDLRGVDVLPVLELPLVLQGWEPPYPLADYKADEADFASPSLPALVDAPLHDAPVRVDADATDALRGVASVWATESNGRVEAMCVDGDALGAIRALGVLRARVAPIPGGDALALLAWAAASGGAHGRRRGMAPGRFAAWGAAVAVAGELDQWPLHPDDVGDIVTEHLRWYAWDAHEPDTGWSIRLAVEDVDRGRSYALAATDAA